MEPTTLIANGALISVILGLVELIKYLLIRKKQNGNGHLTSDQATQLAGVARFCDQHEVRWVALTGDVEELKAELKDNNRQINRLVASQERLTERITELITRMDHVLLDRR